MDNPQELLIIKTDKEVIYTPFSLFEQWVQKRAFPMKLHYGQQEIPITVLPHPDQKEEYKISDSICRKLNLNQEHKHHIYESNHMLHIGPVLGIFTAGFTGVTKKPVGERSAMFAKLLSEARHLGVTAYVFGSHHIDWEQKHIKGYLYGKQGWTQRTVPFPNIVYDRLPNRRIEDLPAIIETKNKLLNTREIQWFNPGFFNKWNIHQLLIKDSNAAKFLPDTYNNPTLDDIDGLLYRYKNVYLKPSGGSLGIGIQQIIKGRKDPYYYCRFRTNEQNRLRRYSSLKRLIRQQFPEGTKGFMVQRGINLLHFNGDPIDYRVHTNRNRHGEWEVSALAAKIAGTGSVTTHVTSGGKILTLQDIINGMGISKSITEHIKGAALQLSESLSESIDGIIGEIGFDLGVDTTGNVWLFEANSKPGRSIFTHPNLNVYAKKTSTLPLEYSIYLFEQQIKQQVAVEK